MVIVKYWADCALSKEANIMNTECQKVNMPEVTVAFTDYPGLDNTARLMALGAEPKQQGYGSKGMSKICSIADKKEINLSVTFTHEWLENFYRKFGFELIHQGKMERIHKNMR